MSGCVQAVMAAQKISASGSPASGTYVVSDNTTRDYAGTLDTRIAAGAATTNFGTDAALGFDPGSDVLLWFDLSWCSPGVTVTSASIIANCVGTGSTNTVTVRPLRRVWNETQVTWNVYSTGNNWGTAGATNTTTDYWSTLEAALSINMASTADKTFTHANIATYVQDCINGSKTNGGFLIKIDDFSGMISREGADGSRPRLSVTLTRP